jgi:DnaJ-class molecular chaperone
MSRLTCTRCQGSGEGWHDDLPCWHCKGAGIEPDDQEELEPLPRLKDEL